MRFLIDDERNFLPGHNVPDMIARTFQAGELILGLATHKDEIWVDHDLGEEDPDNTGYRLLTHFEEFIAYKHSMGVAPSIPKFHIVTSNPAGRQRMKQVIESIERLSQSKPEPGAIKRYREPRLIEERSAAPWRHHKVKEQ